MNFQLVSGMALIWVVLKSYVDVVLLHTQVLNQPLTASRLPQAYSHHPSSLPFPLPASYSCATHSC